ncbi:MAG: hypothetical protein JWQ09_5879 [Segetibacter sp.]|nr:hypothetical protein [Segetibacter sp.]
MQEAAYWTEEQWAQHEAHVKHLKETGEYGKPTETKFNFMPCPEFDSPPTEMKFELFIPKGKFHNDEMPDLPKLRLKDFGLRSSIPEENE